MPTLANAQLIQRKIVTGTTPNLLFWVQESIASPLGALTTPFRVLVVGSTESMTVATYADVAPDTTLTVNPLTGFSRGSSFTGVAEVGDTLTITNPPEYWGANPETVFTVESVDGSGNLVLATPFWTREDALSWTLKRGGASIATGTADGVTQRENPLNNYYLDSQFQQSYLTVTEALAHVQYTQSMVTSLTAAISQASLEFEQAPNPVTNNYTA